jgi:putative ubiquitin-RnfH superfamily antitoxin RatB of RatAB toxin-antitoxin module
VIRVNVVLNTLSAPSTLMLLRIRSAPTLHHAGRSSGLAELSYAIDFDSPLRD